jgi:crossover junction endodeoxyribonuclease RuvC
LIIIGIDTALRCTGYGVLDVDGKQFSAVDCGVIKNKPSAPLSECLRRLAGGIEEIISFHHPEIAAIEGGFYFNNARTAMVLGMARGAVVGILARNEISTYEYPPRKAKQTVVGSGKATKEQVATCVSKMLGLDRKFIQNDSTDALAVALCHVLTAQCGNGVYLKDPI